ALSALGNGWPRRPLASHFQALLERCAGDDLPELVARGPQLFTALVASYSASDELAALEQGLMVRAVMPRAQRERNGASAERSDTLLFVSGMFPSIEHGGGLRLFDIVSGLSERRSVDLYSRYRPATDSASFARLSPALRAAR